MSDLHCPSCGSVNTRIRNYRYGRTEGMRQRVCLWCGAKFLTKEITAMEVCHAESKTSIPRTNGRLFDSGYGEARIISQASDLRVRLLGEAAVHDEE